METAIRFVDQAACSAREAVLRQRPGGYLLVVIAHRLQGANLTPGVARVADFPPVADDVQVEGVVKVGGN